MGSGNRKRAASALDGSPPNLRGRLADFDLHIAATALHHDLTLLTFNLRHFDRVPNLKLYQPG